MVNVISLDPFDNGRGGTSYSLRYTIDRKLDFLQCGKVFLHGDNLYEIYGTASDRSIKTQHAICNLVATSPGGRLLWLLNKVFGKVTEDET